MPHDVITNVQTLSFQKYELVKSRIHNMKVKSCVQQHDTLVVPMTVNKLIYSSPKTISQQPLDVFRSNFVW